MTTTRTRNSVSSVTARIGIVLAGALLLTGCQATASATAATASTTITTRTTNTTNTEIASGGTTADRLDRSTERANEDRIRLLFHCAFPDPTSSHALAAVRALVTADAPAHGAGTTSGRAGLLAEFAADHTRVPGAHAVIKHIAADGDLVAVHWQITADRTNERSGDAAVDLFRLAHGRVTERWSLEQTVPTGTPASGNTNTMFSDLYHATPVQSHPTERQEESNRVLAVRAYDALFRDRDASVLDTDFDPAYLQHNAVAANGTAALKQFFAGAGASFPPQQSVISLSDGDLVWTFSTAVSGGADAPVLAADLFRVDGGLIREHWDVVPAASGS